MDGQTVMKAIEVLEHVRERPVMFLYELSEQAADQWLSGFQSACYAFGVPYTLEVRREAAYKRGWGFPAAGPTGEMRERGYTEAQVVDELLMIEITTLQMLLTPLE